MLIIGKSQPDFKIKAMTRSIPSIIVLSLMCFTISYGIVRFPNAGILDAAQSSALSSTDRSEFKQTTLRMTADGSALLQDESPAATVLEESQATSEELFTEQTTPPAENAVDAKTENDAPEATANKAPENKKKKSSKGGSKAKESKKSDASASTADAADNAVDAPKATEFNESELPTLESEPVNSAAEKDNSQELIGIPNDKSDQDNFMPIETDQDPLPQLDKNDQEIPSIFVDNNSLGTEPEPLSDPEPPMQEDLSIPEMTPEAEKSVEDYWNTVFDENAPANKEKSLADSGASSAPEKKTPKTAAPTEIKTDPNAQEIPPRNRETKPANTDVLTLPALDEPQNVKPNVNQPDTGTIPMESFPLDASAVQQVDYTVDYQQEPFDQLGFDIPETGPVVVKRLPSVENSVDPIYNNAQLDRFAL